MKIDVKMLRIHMSTLVPDLPVNFDVYIKVADHHVRYIRKNDELDKSRFLKLKSKNVQHLFIEENAQAEYQMFLNRGLDKIKNTNDMSVEEISHALIGQSKTATQQLYENPEKKENFTHAQEIVKVQVDHLLNNKDALDQMLSLENYDKSIYQHCVNVSALAVGLAQLVGAPENVCEVIGLGALMHDIGKTKLDVDPAATLETVDKKDYDKLKMHPRVGCEQLQGKKYISKDVMDIILLHEERIDGKGYPGGVKKIDQIFQVVGLANMLDRMVTFEGKTYQEAYKIISSILPLPYEKELIESMKDVIDNITH